MSETRSTKDRILDAAERLFADQGFAATSLRDITAEAGANLAAVNYHFKSKESLIVAVVARRARPLNERRLAMLDECEARAGHGPLEPECVFRAFLEPMLAFRRQLPTGASPSRLIGQVFTEPGGIFRELFRTEFHSVAERFLGALRRIFPELPEEEMFWRFQFTLGALVHTISGEEHLRVISGGLCDSSDDKALLERLVAYAVAGFRAPAPKLAQRGGYRCEVS
jgi:AcrR family transcriptional regulator